MLLLVANDLADIGYFCSASFNPSKNAGIVRPTIIGLVPLLANIDMFNSGSGGISFVVKNIRVKRRIRFKILLQDYTDAISGTDINVGGFETKWYVTMRVSPIE